MSATKFATYDQKGKAEDFSDIITDISPTDTPFLSSIKNEKTHATIFSWQEDALAAAAANARIEGADAANAAQTATTERTNRTQILTKTVSVSGTSDAIKTYGRAKESAYQIGKALKEIKRDYERAMVGVSNAQAAGSDGSAAREMDSVDQQISTTVDAGSNATDPFTEAKLLSLGQTCYENGSEPTMLMIKPADSLIVGALAQASGRNREIAQGKTLVNVIDLLVTPFGEYRVVINRHQLTTHAFLIDPAMFSSVTLRPFTRTLLAKDGDSDKHFIVGEVSVKHRSFADSGMITGLS